MTRRRTAAMAATLLFALAACGSDDNSNSTAAPTTQAPVTSPATVNSTEDTSTNSTEDPSTNSTEDTSMTSTDDTSLTGGTVISEDRMDQAQEALQAGDFSTMLQALKLSGLADEIKDREITILAPTDEAFQELTRDELSDLLTNPTKIDDILKRHILDGVYTFDELKQQTEVTTISDETLPVSTSGDQLQIAGATVTERPDSKFDGSDGQELAVFAIDKVLLNQG